MKICKNCTHCSELCWCARDVKERYITDLLTGEQRLSTEGSWKWCRPERESLFGFLPWVCGKSGKFFKEKS